MISCQGKRRLACQRATRYMTAGARASSSIPLTKPQRKRQTHRHVEHGAAAPIRRLPAIDLIG